MSNPPSVQRIGLAVGLLAAGVIIWVWRQGELPAEQTTTGARQVSPAATPDQPDGAAVAVVRSRAGDLSARARSLLNFFDDLLARRDVRPNETVLTFRDEAALRRFLARAGRAGLNIIGQVDALRSVRVRFDDANALRREVLDHADDYVDASANYLVSIPQPPPRESRDAVEQVPFGNRALEFLGATGDRSQWGRGTTIAVLDTGVAADPTFGSGRLRTLDIGFGVAPAADSAKAGGHGTAVAALAAGSAADAPGVAPAANVLSIRVTDASGTSDIFTLSQAIVAAVDAGARIVNVSLGGYATNAALNNALAYASDRGALVVAAAGNDQAAQLAWPAADARVLSVGAIDAAEQQVVFSNSGPQLQLTAPGYGVQTAWLEGQRVHVNGTSASAPLVSGAVAAMMSQNPTLSPQQAAQVLLQTASDGGTPGADAAFGHGILNLGWAMNRHNPGYVDTAVASHVYDPATNQVHVVVQNRSGRSISGLSLQVTAGTKPTTYHVPSLTPGESFVARVPADTAALRATGGFSITTQLQNPTGVTDQLPANNRRSSVLSAPRK